MLISMIDSSLPPGERARGPMCVAVARHDIVAAATMAGSARTAVPEKQHPASRDLAIEDHIIVLFAAMSEWGLR
jgi:hypothetical protein